MGAALARIDAFAQRTAANDNYNWYGANVSRSYSRNGLNQYTAVSGTSYGYDARGNLTSDGTRLFCYDLENHLLTVGGAANCGSPTLSLSYDPLGRLQQSVAGSATTQFLYDGDRLSAEYNSGGTVLRRYVHGPGVDEPITWYEGSGTSDRRYLVTDHQGTVIAENGVSTTRYSYGPYGEPNAWAGSRFRYTGQVALPEVSLYHYKARVYDPVLGRFLQTDPVGYEDDLNLYMYVGNDPLNRADPTGRFPDDDRWFDRTNGTAQNLPSPQQTAAALPDVAPDSPGQAVEALGNVVSAASIALGQPEGVAAGRGISAVGNGMQAVEARSGAAGPAGARAPGPDFVVTPKGEAIPVPTGASGPTPTRAPGMQFTGGTGGGPGMNSRVTGVRVMDANSNQGPRAVYMNSSGQTVNPATGRTVPNSDPAAHQYLEPYDR